MVGARSRSRPIQIHSHQPESDLNDPVALTQWSGGDQKSFALTANDLGVAPRAAKAEPRSHVERRRRFGEADLISGDAGGSNSRFGGMAARASHWGASDAAGLYLALGDEAEVPAPLVGSDALVAPRPATARSVTRCYY